MVWFLCILFINFAPLRFKTVFSNHYLAYIHIILYKFTFIYFFILIYFYLYRRKLLTIYLQLYQRGAAKGRASNFVRKLALVTRHFARKIRRGPENDPKKSPIFSENGQSGDHFQELETHFQQVGDHFQANRDHFLKMVSVFLIRSNYWTTCT